jgi:ketosteroid isomerase-like protein
MEKLINFLAIICVTANGSFAQSRDADLAQLRKVNATFIHNFVTNDTASHNRIIHKDFVCISEQGTVVPRDAYLKAWAHGFDMKVYKYWDYREEKIRLFGDMALVRAVNKYIIINDGKEVTGMTIYTDTYVRVNGQWRCVQAQITPVSPENFRGDDSIVRKYENQ